MEKLIAVVNELRTYKTEKEWFEFKGNWFEPKEMGEYIAETIHIIDPAFYNMILVRIM